MISNELKDKYKSFIIGNRSLLETPELDINSVFEKLHNLARTYSVVLIISNMENGREVAKSMAKSMEENDLGPIIDAVISSKSSEEIDRIYKTAFRRFVEEYIELDLKKGTSVSRGILASFDQKFS